MDQIAQVREKTDIVALISEYLPLKKMGRNFKSNCPFHNEKTPSFVVSPERQIWHCFGCGKGGDCFTFLMEYETMEFPEALRILAKKAGVELKELKFEGQTASKKEKLYEVNHLAMEFYHFLLTKHNVGKKALQYLLETRKMNEGAIKTFMLGIAPSMGNPLTRYLITKKKYVKEDLLDAGISTYRGSQLTDFFQGRLMFPLIDHRDNVVGFSGRTLYDTKTSKYINTRDTLIYQKGTHFFGINIAKDHIKKEGRAIVMEGEFDVISAFQEGFSNSVAIKGSALTEQQVLLLSRFTPKVTLCFDMDNAGQAAIAKSVPLLEKKGLLTTVIDIPNGKDADESIKKDPIAFKKAVKEDIGVYDYLIQQAINKFDVTTSEGKKLISEFLVPFIGGIENEIVKEHYVRKLSKELEVSYESASRQVDKMAIQKTATQVIVPTTNKKRDREEILEEYLVALIIQCDTIKTILQDAVDTLGDRTFKIPAYRKLLDQMLLYCKRDQLIDGKSLGNMLPKELEPVYNTSYLFSLPTFENNEAYLYEIRRVSKELQVLHLRKQIKEMGDKIKEKEKEGDSEDLNNLRTEFLNLIGLLQKA